MNKHSPVLALAKEVEKLVAKAETLQQQIKSLEVAKQQLQSSVSAEQDKLAASTKRIQAENAVLVAALKKDRAKLVADNEAIASEIAAKDSKAAAAAKDLERELVALEHARSATQAEKSELLITCAKQETAASVVNDLKVEADTLRQEKQELIDSIADLTNQAAERQATVSVVDDAIVAAKQKLSDLDKDYATRRQQQENELAGILIRCSDAVTQLKQLESQGERERRQIATDRIALQKERESFDRLKAQLTDAESKIARYNKYAKL